MRTAVTARSIRPLLRSAIFVALVLVCAMGSGCTSMSVASKIPLDAVAKLSPVPETATPYEAVENAKAYVSSHPGSDFAVGSGDSMLPLYRDRDVIVLDRPSIADLKLGETVMFMGENGVPVAHVIINRTSSGWVTMGLGNAQVDSGAVREDNYMGVVVKAYRPTGSPILAYWATSPENPDSSVAKTALAAAIAPVGANGAGG